MNRVQTLVTASLGLLLVAVLTIIWVSTSPGSATGSNAGTGSASSGTASAGPGSSSAQIVTIKGFAFHPSTLTVKAGTKVTFINQDGVAHTATSNGTHTFDSGALNKGQSYTYTFTKPGTYKYLCSIHNYMKGTVIVQ